MGLQVPVPQVQLVAQFTPYFPAGQAKKFQKNGFESTDNQGEKEMRKKNTSAAGLAAACGTNWARCASIRARGVGAGGPNAGRRVGSETLIDIHTGGSITTERVPSVALGAGVHSLLQAAVVAVTEATERGIDRVVARGTVGGAGCGLGDVVAAVVVGGGLHSGTVGN